MIRPAYYKARRLIDMLIERWMGIETFRVVTLRELGMQAVDRVDYEPSSWVVLRRVLSPRDVTEEDVFIDFGCGKGRVLIQAANYPFRKIIGVELSAELTAIARRNLARILPSAQCRQIELVNADVLDYEIPDEITLAYFYNPFEGEIFRRVIDKLVRSVIRCPRTVRIIYFSPREEAVLLEAGARLIKVVGGLRPTAHWSKMSSIRLYALAPPK